MNRDDTTAGGFVVKFFFVLLGSLIIFAFIAGDLDFAIFRQTEKLKKQVNERVAANSVQNYIRDHNNK